MANIFKSLVGTIKQNLQKGKAPAITYENLMGKTLLAGLTYYTKDNVFIEQKQLWGTVIEANEEKILVRQSNGEVFSLPPNLRAITVARPGEYRLRSTGEVVVNPDFLATWTINVK